MALPSRAHVCISAASTPIAPTFVKQATSSRMAGPRSVFRTAKRGWEQQYIDLGSCQPKSDNFKLKRLT